MRHKIDWQMILVAIVATAALTFVAVMAITMDDIEEQRSRDMRLPQPELNTLEDSVHYYEDGL